MTEQVSRLAVSDEELVREARTGSSASIDELWRRYQRRIFLFIRRKVGTDQDAEDILQDTFIKAMRYLDRFDEKYRFSGWLFTICNQLIISHYRRRKEVELPQEIPNCSDGPAETAETDSLKERLWKAASRLPKKQFDVIWLRYVENMTVAEVARCMSISGINTRVLLHRARLALMREVSEVETVEEGARANMIEVTS